VHCSYYFALQHCFVIFYRNRIKEFVQILFRFFFFSLTILFFIVIAMFVLICNNNIINLINIFIVAFLIYFIISKRFLIMFFEIFICLRNLFRLCLFKTLLFLSHIRMYVVYLLEIQYYRHNFLIFLIIFVHFAIYLNLIFFYNLAYKIKFLIIFLKH